MIKEYHLVQRRMKYDVVKNNVSDTAKVHHRDLQSDDYIYLCVGNYLKYLVESDHISCLVHSNAYEDPSSNF